jgi:adenylate cyclase
MALFGLQVSPEEGSLDALRAARNMSVRLAELNTTLESDLDAPLRIGIGIHLGPAIVGEMGFGTATSLTAIGDSVNTASRLESMTKEYGAQLIVSESVERKSGLDLSEHPLETVSVRGREEALGVRVIPDASKLAVPDRTRTRTRQKETAD